VVGILLIVVLVGAAGFWYVRENPLAVYERTTRRELAKAGMERARTDVNSGKLVYWSGGDGPPMVLLHGVGDQAGAFQGVVEALLPDYDVVIPDLPGHGESEPADGPLSMQVVYGGLEEFLGTSAGAEPYILVGSSMGAWMATTYAHRHPERVARIVLVNGGALTGERADLSLTPVDREAARTLMAALRDPSSPVIPDFVLDDIVEQSAKGPIGRMMQAWEDFQPFLLDGRLHEVTVPVDLLWGESDQLMKMSYAERMAAELPRSRLTTIAGCGHHPANECPAKLAEGLVKVLGMDPPPAKEPPSVETELELSAVEE
jgi:pimeloyl-ACP methyl ester carboxylesterase